MSAAEAMDETWPLGKKQMVTAIAASSLGWALDLFDLFILLYVAPTVGKLIRPSALPTLSLAAVYASLRRYATDAAMLGSALFMFLCRSLRGGAAAAASFLSPSVGVGIITALFGALPTIKPFGVAAPVIFLVLPADPGTVRRAASSLRPTPSAPQIRCRPTGAEQCRE